MSVRSHISVGNISSGEQASTAPQEVTLNGIVDAVSQYYGVIPDELLAKDTVDSGVNDARAIMLTLVAEHTPLSHEKIADVVGRYQSTVSQVIRRVREQADNDPKLRQHLDELTRAAAGEPLATTLSTWPELITQHYGLSADEIAASRTPRATEARQVMAHLLVENTVLRNGAVARRTGLATSANVSYAVQRVTEKRQKDPRFDEDLSSLETGQLPDRLKPDDILDMVTAYYGIERDKLLGNSRKDQHTRPRAMAKHLLASELGYSHSEVARVFGNKSGVRDAMLDFDQRLEADHRLQQQRAEILDPKTVEKEPASHRLIKIICSFYGVAPTEIVEERPSGRFSRPREVTAYLLRSKLGLSVPEVMSKLQRSESAVLAYNRKLEAEIKENPMLVAQLEYLERAKRIGRSINERIISRVSEATAVDPNDILGSKDPEAIFARQMAMSVMAESGHLSSREIAEIFGLVTERAVYRAKTVIEFQRHRTPQLIQQMDYVRNKIVTEKPSTFNFDKNATNELRESEEILLQAGLPDIDERLVAPAIRERIYSIVEQVAAFYDIPATEVIGRTDEFVISRARRAAVLLCYQARIPLAEAAICFDARTTGSLGNLIENAQADLEEHYVFAEELKAVAQGESRRDVLAETLESVVRFYGIKPSEIISGKTQWPARARAVFLMVMTELAYTTQRQLGEKLKRSENTVSAIVQYTKKRLERDPRLRAEIEYILRPSEVPRPPVAKDIIRNVGEVLGISTAKLHKPMSQEEKLAKRLTAYLLAEELAMPHPEIATMLNESLDNVVWYMRRTREEIAKNPKYILEIDRLRPPNSTSMSITGRVITFVTKRYGVDLVDIGTNDQTTELNHARSAAVNLLIKRAGHSVDQVVKILGLPKAVAENLIQ